MACLRAVLTSAPPAVSQSTRPEATGHGWGMATNEELQAQIDALRAALGSVPGLRVQDMSPTIDKVSGHHLRVWSSSELERHLDRFDELRIAE